MSSTEAVLQSVLNQKYILLTKEVFLNILHNLQLSHIG